MYKCRELLEQNQEPLFGDILCHRRRPRRQETRTRQKEDKKEYIWTFNK